MNRRTFLTRMAGLGALTALPGLASLRARAADEHDGPRRLLLWYQPNGYGQDPHGVHARSLETMSELRDKITWVRGMHLPTGGGGHEIPMETMLTGANGGPSIDQILAGELSGEGGQGSLTLGVRAGNHEWGTRCSYISEGNATPLLPDPRATWAAVFSNLQVDPEQQEALWARRDLIMSHNQQAAESMRSRLASTQRERLDQYIASIDEIRDDMTSLVDTSEACVVPPQPAETPNNGDFDYTNYESVTDGQISLMAHALTCDLTRVGLIHFSRSVSKVEFEHVLPFDFMGNHHVLTHEPNSEQAREQLQLIHDWYDAKFLSLLQALDSRTDVDGSTVLDNTIVIRVSECMKGNGHEFDHGHHLIAGGGNFINSGVDLDVDDDDPTWKLWLTIAQALGVDLPDFAGYSGGIYDQLLA